MATPPRPTRFCSSTTSATTGRTDYLPGFPWHPHRGIETITYVLAGNVEHGDSLGNTGSLGAGDVQWMTAGSGIIHQEMPHGDDRGRMHGFQLWANLPSSLKMTDPRYQDVTSADIPEVVDDDGTRVRIICGSFWGATGPVDGVAAEPQYLDVWVPAADAEDVCRWRPRGTPSPMSSPVRACSAMRPSLVRSPPRRSGWARPPSPSAIEDRSLVIFDRGDEVVVDSGETGIRFLLVSGKPLGEPVAWAGPIVMNTDAELRQAFAEYRDGTFLKHR